MNDRDPPELFILFVNKNTLTPTVLNQKEESKSHFIFAMLNLLQPAVFASIRFSRFLHLLTGYITLCGHLANGSKNHLLCKELNANKMVKWFCDS